jgi:hypothetical protein
MEEDAAGEADRLWILWKASDLFLSGTVGLRPIFRLIEPSEFRIAHCHNFERLSKHRFRILSIGLPHEKWTQG